jgi:hypothetical protein
LFSGVSVSGQVTGLVAHEKRPKPTPDNAVIGAELVHDARQHSVNGGPKGPSHAIGCADPGDHLPGFAAYEQDGED